MIIGLAFIPAAQVFEGNLIVEELSFICDRDNPPDKLFLNSIRSLNRIEIEGKQKIMLSGQFDSEEHENLKQLKDNTLEIELDYPDSRLIIEPIQSQQASQLELEELRLQPETAINPLTYQPSDRSLFLSLTPPEDKPNLLKLSLGEKPLKIILESYRLPQLDKANKNIQDYLEFTFIPFNTELDLTLKEVSNLYINLPDPTKVNTQEWLWGNLTVKDVKFSRIVETDNINDELEFSTSLRAKLG